MFDIGFTGTRDKLTDRQIDRLVREMDAINFIFHATPVVGSGKIIFHHGDCIGADAFAHKIALKLEWTIIIHPPIDEKDRAFCEGAKFTREPLPYMKRNQNIVDAAHMMIAVPPTDVEQQRGGTWSTYRKAKKACVPTTVICPTVALTRYRHAK